jgi:hypothetical protein
VSRGARIALGVCALVLAIFGFLVFDAALRSPVDPPTIESRRAAPAAGEVSDPAGGAVGSGTVTVTQIYEDRGEVLGAILLTIAAVVGGIAVFHRRGGPP